MPRLAAASARHATPAALVARSRAIGATGAVYERALVETLAAAHTRWETAPPARRGPLTGTALRRRYAVEVGIPYGPDPAHRLDVWRAPNLPMGAAAPVLLYLPAGGWVYGSRRFQAHHMLGHLASQGWVCLAIDYRVAPRHRWPGHIQDVKRAIAWTRKHVAGYGGDPGFLALAGCSAGGHLASLAGLSANDRDFQAGVTEADTSVDAVVSIYGRYDWQDRRGEERAAFMNFLERVVVQRAQAAEPDTFRAASPLARVGPDAPPFLVIHGTADTIIPVEQAQQFVAALRDVSRAPVAYAELPAAQHGFDLLNNDRTAQTAVAVECFLRAVRNGRNVVPEAG